MIDFRHLHAPAPSSELLTPTPEEVARIRAALDERDRQLRPAAGPTNERDYPPT